MQSERSIAIVTGGARGLGFAMAKALIAEGMRVALLDTDGPGLARAQTALSGLGNEPTVLSIRCDVSDEGSVQAAIERICGQWGPPSILINNAAIGPDHVRATYGNRPLRFLEVGPVVFSRFLSVNLRGPYNTTRAVLPFLLATGWGRIVNVTTGLGIMLAEGFYPYGATKAGLESMSAVLAAELEGTGATVNVLAPGGAIDTAMCPPESFPDRRALLAPDIVSPPIRFLASRAADGFNGWRIIASRWRADQTPTEAARLASRPIGWPELAGE